MQKNSPGGSDCSFLLLPSVHNLLITQMDLVHIIIQLEDSILQI